MVYDSVRPLLGALCVVAVIELYNVEPNDDRIPEPIAERWSIRAYGLTADELRKELDDILAHTAARSLAL